MLFAIAASTALSAVPQRAMAEPVGGIEHFNQVIRPYVETYCAECHIGDDRKSDIDLSSIAAPAEFSQNDELLDLFLWVLEDESMPPRDAKQPRADHTEAVMAWLDAQLRAGKQENDPGLVHMSRLTRVEYGNVIRDLTGIVFDPRPHLPAEGGAGEGFSNVGEGQLMSVGELEQFLNAAKAVTRHLRAVPGLPLEWHDAPLDEVKRPDELRREMVDRWKTWHINEQYRREELHKQLEDNYGLSDGLYWEALWLYNSRESLPGVPDDVTLETLAKQYEPHLYPSALRNWKRYLDKQKAEYFVMERFFERWKQLPGPDAVSGIEELREHLKPLEEWAQTWGRMPYHVRFPTIQERRFYSGNELKEAAGEGRYPLRLLFHRVEDEGGQIKDLYLIATDLTDGNREDILVWRDGYFLFGDRKNPTREPWQNHVEFFTTPEGTRLSWGSHPQDAPLEPGAIGVQAPAILRIKVPEDAIGLDVEGYLDQERYPSATMQQYVTHDLEELHVSDQFDSLRFIPGRNRIHADKSDKGRTVERAINEAEDVFKLTRLNSTPESFWLYDVEGIDLALLPVKPLDEDVRARNVIIGVGETPYAVSPQEMREEANPERRQSMDDLLARLKATIQKPQQELLALLKENGYKNAVEDVIPPAEVTHDWEDGEKERFEQLAHAIKAIRMQEQRYARDQLLAFAHDAWRRQVADTDIETIMRLYRENRAQGNLYDTAVKHAMHFILVSPKFIYRIQAGEDSPEAYALNDYELADRLAFFLWASIPDQELLDLAAAGKLSDAEVLRAQARRMLADDRARALGEAFAGQWMGFYNFRGFTDPDPETYPEYTEELRHAMFEESVQFFTHIFQAGRPLTEIVTADYTFLNESLAEHYGVPGVTGEDFRKVKLPQGKPRGGIITQGTVLTGTSMPLRTSPVNRGVWILENLLGEHLPAPPPNVPPLSDEQVSTDGLTIPEQLARHREDPACMNCHMRIDPLGLSLEQFNPVGGWREEYPDGTPVDPSGQDAQGTPIVGVQGLIDYLMARDEKVLRQFNRKLLGYALGRGIGKSDDPLLDDMLEALQGNDYQFAAALDVIVSSKQFRFRRDNPDLALNQSSTSILEDTSQ